ncbi:MAG: hypothetical protein ABF449_00540 [Ethanoligenens sp.]
MLNTNVNPIVQSTSTISATDANGVSTVKNAFSATANINSQTGYIHIDINPGDMATLMATTNNASTQVDLNTFWAQFLAACANSGLACYAPSATK